MTPHRGLCISGSPKPTRSTGAARCGTWVRALFSKGVEATAIELKDALRSGDGRADLRAGFLSADIAVLAFPIQVDTVPALVVEGLEEVFAATARRSPPARLFAVVNSGFHEAWHCGVAVDVCRHFAEACKLDRAGSLSIAMGGIIDGDPVETCRLAKGVLQGISLAADDLAAGKAVRERAVQLAERPMIPLWLYTLVVTLDMHSSLVRRGTWWRRQPAPSPAVPPDAAAGAPRRPGALVSGEKHSRRACCWNRAQGRKFGYPLPGCWRCSGRTRGWP